MSDQPLYTSEPIILGRHQWRLRIRRNGRGQMVTEYQFQQPGECFWQASRDWPRYDINDTYLGLPRSLQRLYDRETHALETFGLKPRRAETQLDLFAAEGAP